MKTHWRILVVDDEAVMCESLAAWLREDGYAVDTASSGHQAVEMARTTDYAIYFVDLKMPGGMDGIETMMQIRRLRPDASIIIITAYATVDTAITAMKEGAQEYIVKPCNPEEISLLVSRIIKVKNLQRENTILRMKLTRQYHFRDVISKSACMRAILDLAAEVASLPSTVLILGDSGTGKELIARAIHYSGQRAAKPFVAVSCAALAETLLESELFGYEKGAFTGADQQKRGKFELADGGTIFLDEIGDMTPATQTKILRVLQAGTFERVGGNTPIRVDVRIIAATNKPLEQAVAARHFREDLFYRLNVVRIHIPPLRERREDIPLLVNYFLGKFAKDQQRPPKPIGPSVGKALEKYHWPGNVRELENIVRRALVVAKGDAILVSDLPAEITGQSGLGSGGPASGAGLTSEASSADIVGVARQLFHWAKREPKLRILPAVERELVIQALKETSGNQVHAAKLLGITRATLRKRVEKFGIQRELSIK